MSNGITLSLAACRIAYSTYFEEAMPEEIPYKEAFRRITRDIMNTRYANLGTHKAATYALRDAVEIVALTRPLAQNWATL